MIRFAAAILLTLLAAPAFAHVGEGLTGGFLGGFEHPLFGPDHVVVTLSLEFADHLTTPEIETIIVQLEQHIRAAHPAVIAIFVKPQTARTYGRIAQERYGTRG